MTITRDIITTITNICVRSLVAAVDVSTSDLRDLVARASEAMSLTRRATTTQSYDAAGRC